MIIILMLMMMGVIMMVVMMVVVMIIVKIFFHLFANNMSERAKIIKGQAEMKSASTVVIKDKINKSLMMKVMMMIVMMMMVVMMTTMLTSGSKYCQSPRARVCCEVMLSCQKISTIVAMILTKVMMKIITILEVYGPYGPDF